MTRLAIILAAILLTGCTKTVSVTPTPVAMPALPPALAQRAEPLPPISGHDLKTVLRDGVATDRAYADVRTRLNAVLDAWECVRLALASGKPSSTCLGKDAR